MSDFGFTHVALAVSDIDASVSFYTKYARMTVVHRREDKANQSEVAWISDLTRPFVIVLIKTDEINGVLLPESHLGVACRTREEVDHLCDEARLEGVLLKEASEGGYPVGYWAYIRDPDGHTLEVSYGQEISFTVKQAMDN
ncbi:VOC family protein [Nostoc sp. MS1]|uniref:VOC family protein n=1 Tax=Nostoc sp. MS1 TaxID=2764711 RepID=UPI001CC7094E|nr:VOC family protein [Nostoc sp. MS1]BCL39343.1 hypothetical protein NSMS1_57900 [Nostoc sp. MS1]